MGTYFNPNNESFTCDKNSKIYIDKTGLLEYLNDVICTNGKYIDLSTVASKDDALTALIHLGYLGYDADGEDKKKHICVIEELHD